MRLPPSFSPRTSLFTLALVAIPLVTGSGCQRQPTAPPAAGAASAVAAENAVLPVSASPIIPTTPAPFASPPLLPGTPDVAALVAKVKPSVVNITTVHEIHRTRGGNVPFDFDMSPFGMAPPGNPRGGDQVFKQQALGSGFIIDTKGHVVTNAHVIDDADEVKVKLADEREFSAKVIGRDKQLDLAVLELSGASELPAAALGSSEQLRVGEYVVAIGNPFGLGHTVTMGIVSAKDRAIGPGSYVDDFIQTDASINPGNSGGPLFNLKGEVVGINTAINPNGKGIGFAIPVDALKEVVDQLVRTGHVVRGRLGVAIQPVDDTLGKALGTGKAAGALVAEVQPGAAAARAGLKSGDVIVALDGASVANSYNLPRLVARHAPGSHTKVEYIRNGKHEVVDVTLDELKTDTSSDGSSSSGPESAAPGGIGIEVGESPQHRGEVVIGRVASGSAAEGQLVPGDVILEVNRFAVHSAQDVGNRVKESGKTVLFKIRREGNVRFVAVERAAQ